MLTKVRSYMDIPGAYCAPGLSFVSVALSLLVSGLCNFVTFHDWVLGGAGSKEQ